MATAIKVEEVSAQSEEFAVSSASNGHRLASDNAENNRASEGTANGDVKALGSAQITLGLSQAFFGSFLFTDLSVAASMGTPWWSGIPLIIAGSLTVISEKNLSNKGLLMASFGINIITCILIGFSVLMFSFDVAVTVIFALIYRHWIISFLMKGVFLVVCLAGLGISVAVLVIERKRISPETKPEIFMQSLEVLESPSHAVNSSE